jgi:hypothetical protein
MVFDHFHNTRGTKSGQHFGILMLASGLSQVDRVTKDVFDILWHRIQIALGRTDPLEGFANLFRHWKNYVFLGIFMSIIEMVDELD